MARLTSWKPLRRDEMLLSNPYGILYRKKDQVGRRFLVADADSESEIDACHPLQIISFVDVYLFACMMKSQLAVKNASCGK